MSLFKHPDGRIGEFDPDPGPPWVPATQAELDALLAAQQAHLDSVEADYNVKRVMLVTELSYLVDMSDDHWRALLNVVPMPNHHGERAAVWALGGPAGP